MGAGGEGEAGRPKDIAEADVTSHQVRVSQLARRVAVELQQGGKGLHGGQRPADNRPACHRRRRGLLIAEDYFVAARG